jgi:23S rRNA (pseudouridine1915-N3)-methyltransferase
MRLWIFAIGSARGSSEGALCEEYIDRAVKLGRNIGFSAVHVEELPVAKGRDAKLRMADEAERLAARLPDGAHIVLLDARGKGMTSEDFAEMLAALRDAGTRDLVFVVGGPDGLLPLPGKKAGRSLAFGPQTWPHLLARVLLSEQVYRAMTILAGHPYHRP